MRYQTITEYLSKKKKTQSKLAGEIGISVPFLNQIIGGKRTPSLPVAIEISRKTGIPIERLIDQERATA